MVTCAPGKSARSSSADASRRSALRAASTTPAPSPTSARAHASPMPDPPPVISAVCSASGADARVVCHRPSVAQYSPPPSDPTGAWPGRTVGQDGRRDTDLRLGADSSSATTLSGPGARSQPGAVGAALHPDARRHGRRRDQDRTTRRRPHQIRHAAPQRAVELFRAAERRQTEPVARPGDAGRGRHPAGADRAGRRPRRELPARRHGATRPRRRDGARPQPATRLRVDLRVRPDRAVGQAARVCTRRGSRSRHRRIAGQRTRWRAGQGPAQPRRPLHRSRNGRCDPGGALPARTDRRGPVDRRVDGRDDALRQRTPPRRAVGRP